MVVTWQSEMVLAFGAYQLVAGEEMPQGAVVVMGVARLVGGHINNAAAPLYELDEISEVEVQFEARLAVHAERLHEEAILLIANGEAPGVSLIKHSANSAQNALVAVLTHRSRSAPPLWDVCREHPCPQDNGSLLG